jgi:transporter
MEVLKKNKGRILNYLQIILGCFITAFSVNCILVPNKLSTSGVTGLSQMAERFTGINYSYIYYVFSITILIIAFFTLRREEFMKIIFVSFLYPTLLVLTGMFHFVFVQGEMFLVCIYFSIFYGLGSGLVLRAGVTFGGTDTVARILNRKVFKGVALSRVMLFLDGSILISLGFVFNKDVALYALVNHVICIYIMDYMLFGFRQKLYKTNIIPASQDDSDDITRYILSLGRGVTMYKAVGAYTKSDKIMLSSIISPRQSALIRSYLAEHFPNAFMEVSPIVTVYGTGERFVRIKGED